MCSQCGVYKPTNVLSISYGAWGYPDNYVKRQCSELMKLGLQGVTIVVSSGDSGVGEDKYCAAGPDGLIFYSTMMSECPYVLSVGSTQLDRPAGAPNPPPPFEVLNEVATKRFPSGGGFSNVFGVPSWQKPAITAYFDQVDLPFSSYHHFVVDNNFSSVKGGRFHHGGRAYPDIGAIGDRQVVHAGGLWYRVGGTSLSAPVVASMVTLVNEARLAAGKGPVGYFTPTLVSILPIETVSTFIRFSNIKSYSTPTLRCSQMSQSVVTLAVTLLALLLPRAGIQLQDGGKSLSSKA